MIGIGEFIARAKGLVAIPLLTAHIGAAGYGLWAQIAVLAATLAPVAILGTDSAIVRMLPGLPEAAQRASVTAWFIALGVTGAATGLVLMVADTQVSTAFFGGDDEFLRFVPLAVATLFASLIRNGVTAWQRVRNQAVLYTSFTIIEAILTLGAIVLVVIVDGGVYDLALYNLVAQAAVIAGFMCAMQVRGEFAAPDFSRILALVRFGLPLVPAGYAMWGLNAMDRIFLVHYSSLTQVGIYSVAYSLGYLVIQLLVNPIWTLFPSRASQLFDRQRPDEVQRLVSISARAMFFLAAPVIAATAVLGGPIIDLMATEQFTAGALVIPIVALGYLAHMFGSFFDIALGLAYRQYLSAFSILAAVLANFLLNLLLIPPFGIKGAAIATSTAFGLQFLFSWLMARRHVRLVFPWREILRNLAPIALMVAGLLLIRPAMDEGGLPYLLLQTTAGVTIYLGGSFLLGVLPRDEMSRLFRDRFDKGG